MKPLCRLLQCYAAGCWLCALLTCTWSALALSRGWYDVLAAALVRTVENPA